MIAGPSRFQPGLTPSEQAADNVTVRVEDTDIRNAEARNPLLPARFAQQIFRRKCGRLRVVFLREDGRDPAVIDRHYQTNLVVPWPLIGSVLLDSGQAPQARCGFTGRGRKRARCPTSSKNRLGVM